MKIRRTLCLAIIAAMVLQMIAPRSSASTGGKEIPAGQIIINYGTDAEPKTYLKITTAEGAPIAPTGTEEDGIPVYSDIPRDAKIEIRYDFNLESGTPEAPYDYEQGNYFIVNYPDVVKFDSLADTAVRDDSDQTVGTLSLEGESGVRLTLSDYVEDKDDISGWFKINGTFNETVIGSGGGDPVKYEFAGKPIYIGFKETEPEPPEDVDADLGKSGAYDAGTNEITWTIEVTPTTTAAGISITDEFSKNQEYVDGSFEVAGATTPAAITIDGSGTNYKFTYSFPEEIPGGTTKIITYKTTPAAGAFDAENDSNESVIFRNNVKAYYNGEKKDEKNAEVSLNWIQKSGAVGDGTSDSDIRRISWKVDVNNGNYALTGAQITDTIPAGLKLVEGTVKINGEAVSEGDNPGGYTIEENADESKTLVYTFAGTITAKQILTYVTELEDPNADLNSNTQKTYYNTAEFSWNEKPAGSGTPSDSVGVGIGKGVISKDVDGENPDFFDQSNNVITWTVTVNSNKINITNAVLTDDVPVGLEYVGGTFDINDKTGGELNGEFTYTPAASGDTDKSGTLTYEFKKPSSGSDRIIDSVYAMTFQTKVTADSYKALFKNGSTDFPNEITLSGKEIKDGSQTDGGSQTYDSNVIEKSVAEKYDYGTRRTKWEIVVNRSQLPMVKAKVADTLPLGMKFLSETFQVADPAGSPVTATAGSLESDIKADDEIGESDTFTYTFSGTITGKYTITFETEMKEKYLEQNQFASRDFENKAVLTTDSYPGEVEAKASDTVKNPVIEKIADYTGGMDYIDWQVPINHNRVGLGEVTVSDDLQDELLLDTDSVKLYEMTAWNPDGTNPKTKITKGSEVSRAESAGPDAYSFKYNKNHDNLFTVSLPTNTNKAFVLEFTTYALRNDVEVDNTITFSGTGFDSKNSQVSKHVVVNDETAGGSGSSGKLTIVKVDAADTSNELSGAEFKVYDVFNKQAAGDSSDGGKTTVYSPLKYRAYFIEEVTPPAGYLRDPEVKKIILTKDNHAKTYRFTNKKALGDIEFTKKDDSGDVLAGATFELYRKSDSDLMEPLQTVTTGSDGKVSFTDVPLGTYTIKETKTPGGYYTMSKDAGSKINVEVQYNADKTGVVVTEISDVVNEKAYGKIEFTKKTDSGQDLAGAEFTLYDSDGKQVQQMTSGDDGKVSFTDVPLGKYTIKETKAPAGYFRSTYEIQADIHLNDEQDELIQTLSENGTDFDADTGVFKNEKAYGDIKFIKRSDIDNSPLAGATFELYRKSDSDLTGPLQTLTTGSGGKVAFTHLEPGSYIVRETASSDGYFLPPDKDTEVEIRFNDDDHTKLEVTGLTEPEPGQFTITNTKALGRIEFEKQSESGRPLGGAEFTIYKKGGATGIQTVKSDNAGKVVFEGIETGEYEIRETDAPSGFYKTNEVVEATVELINNHTELKVTVSKGIVKNTPRPGVTYGSLEICKVDENGKPLSGAKFTLLNSRGAAVQSGVTGTDGKLRFDFLVMGNYTIRETEAPDGFVLEDGDISVKIHSSAVKTFTVVNRAEKITGSLTVVKTDGSGGKLEGAEFILYDENGVELSRAATGSDGRAVFDKLLLGNYSIKETSAPEGYELSGQRINVQIDGENAKVITVVNRKPGEEPETPVTPDTPGTNVPGDKGAIIIHKIDIASKPLAGAEFTLYDEKGETVATAVSGKDGVAAFRDLEPGKYQVQETGVPKGYALVAEKLTVTVASGQELEYNFRNIREEELDDNKLPPGWIPVDDGKIPEGKPNPGGKLPQAGEMMDTAAMVTAGSALLLTGSGQLLYRRRLKKKKNGQK